MLATLDPIVDDVSARRIEQILEFLCRNNLRLVTAESCTGGLLASLFTDVPGYSHAFDAGIVAYSNQAKIQSLSVGRALLLEYGPVSREVAEAMLEGAFRVTQGDVALAITGFAGPAGPDDEVGLVHVACGIKNRPTIHARRQFGNIGRGKIREACVQLAVSSLESVLGI
jgi:nicotinamide-nucleotide amidase